MLFFILSFKKPTVLFIGFLCSLFLLGLTDAGQEKFVSLNLLHEPSPAVLQSLSDSGVPVAVSVSSGDLNDVSSSVLIAESWVRTRVLTHFPSIRITTIVAGSNVLCNNEQEDKWSLVLPSLKNIYHSLMRWGLEKEIKVSAALSAECLHPLFSSRFRDDSVEKVIQTLLDFLQNSNSTYSVNTPPDSSPSLVYSLENSIKKLGFSRLVSEATVTVISSPPNGRKRASRKLFFMGSSVFPFPATPFVQSAAPPSMSFSLTPDVSPALVPSSPPGSFALPPCYPYPSPGLTPASRSRGEEKELWCVAKPSVPPATLQVAMDYACGGGGADCDEIKPHGRCYYPDTVVAHASYAFNDYWQKNKKKGATCSFGGTAMLINTDPSFLHCRFVLS